MSEPVEVTEQQILQALRTVQVPELGGDVVGQGLIRDVKTCGGNIAVELMVEPASPYRRELEDQVRSALRAIPGVAAVSVTAPKLRPAQAPAPGPVAGPVQMGAAGGGAPGSASLLPGVKHIVAVGSGKGGVGKSTVAVNLAVALALEGAKVGLLDADVYGPSVPMMMGIRRPPQTANGRLIPLIQHGVKLMSLGFLLPDDSSHVIWRGPMVGGAVRQMLADCEWGPLDYLIVDLPPGTGDAQLTLAQSVPLTGAVVVMTSQDVAVNIASKAVGMFQKLNVPILGVVGNMDEFRCPHCGEQTPIFTRGGSEEAARKLGVTFLGSVPLDPQTVEHGDRGTPTVLAAPSSAQAEAFRSIARATAAAVEEEDEEGDPLAGLAQKFRTPS
jgi:ATP-binding protein involved in chromosome partitioning